MTNIDKMGHLALVSGLVTGISFAAEKLYSSPEMDDGTATLLILSMMVAGWVAGNSVAKLGEIHPRSHDVFQYGLGTCSALAAGSWARILSGKEHTALDNITVVAGCGIAGLIGAAATLMVLGALFMKGSFKVFDACAKKPSIN